MKGFDTVDALPDLTGKGYDFTIKYCANSTTFPNKRLTHEERAMCVKAEVKNGFVFEKGNTAEYFTEGQGTADALNALEYFKELGVPTGVTCFYAIDADLSLSQVVDYATAFHSVFAGSGYLTGVYGSGYVCYNLKQRGICHYTWLSNAKGWSGYESWLPHADIVQGLGSVLGLNSDPDTASSLECFW